MTALDAPERFEIGEVRIFTRIGRPTNYAAWYSAAGDKNSIGAYDFFFK
jgi:hypothetical protein